MSWHAYVWTWWHSFPVCETAGSVVHCVRVCSFGLSVIRKQCQGRGDVIMSVTRGDLALYTQPFCPPTLTMSLKIISSQTRQESTLASKCINPLSLPHVMFPCHVYWVWTGCRTLTLRLQLVRH